MKAFLLIFISILLSTIKVSAQTNGDYRSNGSVDFSTAANWQRWNGSAWATATTPPTSAASTNTITIMTGNAATNATAGITVNASLVVSGSLIVSKDLTTSSITVSGTMTVNNGIKLTAKGNITIPNSTSIFNAGLGNSDSATIFVYGDLINHGYANFYKSTVVVSGDIVTDNTNLQNNGDIVVGGNIIGSIGGSGTGSVYSVNPNATVSVTGVTAVTTTPSDPTLASYMNSVIYGIKNPCSVTLTDPLNASLCSGNNAVFNISASAASTFIWQYRSGIGNDWINIPATAPFSVTSTSTASQLTVTGVTAAMGTYEFQVAVTSGTCSQDSDVAFIKLVDPTITAQPSAPTATCSGTGIQTLTVAASGTGLSYSWQKGGTPVINGGVISGQGTSSLTLTNPTSSDAGSYNVVISKSSCASLTSNAVTVTVNTIPTVPTGTAAQTFCSGASPTVANLAAAGTSIQWYSASTGGSALATTTALANGTHYYATQTVSGCGSTSRFDVTATINTTPATPTGTASQTFCSASAIVSSLSATGTAIQWYAASSGGTPLASTASLANATHYYATQTVNGCESVSRFTVTATVRMTPGTPTGTSAQSFCSATSPTVANLGATGTAIQWYAAAAGGSALATSTALANGTHYYATQTASGCESTSRLDVTATVNATPGAPTGTSPQTFCSGSAVVASLAATGLAIQWYTANSGGSPLANAASLTSTTYHASQTVSGCESTARFPVTVTVTAGAAIPTTGVTICQGGISSSLSSSATCALPSNTGAKNAGAATNITGIGTVAWTTPTNIINIVDGNYATVQLDKNQVSNYLQATGYNFSIPNTATINGIKVDINRSGTGITDNAIYLLKAGSTTGISNKSVGASWLASMGVASYGSSNDLWGTTWSPANINASNFGVELSAQNNTNSNNVVTSVDYMQITVYYTDNGVINWYTASSGGTAVGSGTSFNPVGVTNSGLANTNTSGTTTYYAECSNSPGCRTATSYTINSLPAVSFTAQPSANSCVSTDVTYTTQSGMSNYVWALPGTAGTDYSITGGATTSNTVTLKYSTLGSKTVTVNYTNANSCTAVVPSSATTIINPILSASVAIAASPSGAICSGTSVTFTATPTNGGSTPTYQWKRNGTDISGETASTLTTATLANNDVITVVMTSNATPCLTGSPAISNSITMTVIAPMTPFAGSPTQPDCSVNTGSVTLTNLPGSWTLKSGNTTISTVGGNTYTATGLAPGTYTFTVTDTYGCTSAASSAVVINAAPTVPSAPTIGTITQPNITVPTGSFIITNYSSTYTYAINPSVGLTLSGNKATANTGTYTITAKLGSCTSAASSSIIIINDSKTWNGSVSTDWFTSSNWTPIGVPTSNTDVTIPNTTNSSLISSSTLLAYANTITVLTGGKLEVSTANSLNVTDLINVNSGGTLNLFSGASLIQTNKTANVGITNVYRDSAKIILNDYTYWSAPTSGTQTLHNFSPKSNPKYFLEYSNGWIYLDPSTAIFNPGTGYAIIAPKTTSTTVAASVTVQFIGTPNNGDVSVALVKDGTMAFSSTLIGNPYPSAIDANKFIDANIYDETTNPNGTISGTLYFWTHNIGLVSGTYSSNDYATYNKSGGTTSCPSDLGHANTLAPLQYIASGQGFIVEAVKSGSVVFTNALRTNGALSINPTSTDPAVPVNGNFYKNANVAASSTVLEKNRIWLNFTNNGGTNFSQILLGYIETATNGYDPGFDGAYNSSSNTGMYSLLGNSNYTIQAKALPFVNYDTVPLGFVTDVKGNATITIGNVDGLFANGQDIFIEDKLLNVVHNLKFSPYTFSTEAGTFNNRFVLKYTDGTLGLNDLEGISNDVVIVSQNQQVKIHSEIELIDKVFVYDILGREVYHNTKVNSNDGLISDLKGQQVLIVKVVLANGHSASKKVVNQ